MSRYRIYILFSAIIVVGLAGIFLVSAGYYPIALVGGDFISARQFSREYGAASIYYQNLLKTYQPAIGENVGEIKPSDLQLAVINSLIERALIAKGAREEAGDNLQYLVDNKLAKFLGDAELERAALALYGLNKSEFRDSLLIPQAEREILTGRLFLRGEQLEDWLREAKKSARVIIFSPKFEWNGEEVVGSD